MTIQEIITKVMMEDENPKNRVITECEFIAPDENHLEIWVRSNHNGWCEDIKCIGTYELGCADCCTFVSNDFIGLTEDQAQTMIGMSILHTSFIMLGTTMWNTDDFAIDEELPFY